MIQKMEDGYEQLTDQLNNELTKAYLGGLLDGTGSITVKVIKAGDYAFDYTIEPEVQISKKRPHSIQILDDWAASNNIFANVHQYEDRFQFKMNKERDIQRFLELLRPYMKDRAEEVHLVTEEILPLLQESYHLESKENFIEVVEKVDELKELSVRAKGDSKYDADYFREEWADEL